MVVMEGESRNKVQNEMIVEERISEGERREDGEKRGNGIGGE